MSILIRCSLDHSCLWSRLIGPWCIRHVQIPHISTELDCLCRKSIISVGAHGVLFSINCGFDIASMLYGLPAGEFWSPWQYRFDDLGHLHWLLVANIEAMTNHQLVSLYFRRQYQYRVSSFTWNVLCISTNPRISDQFRYEASKWPMHRLYRKCSIVSHVCGTILCVHCHPRFLIYCSTRPSPRGKGFPCGYQHTIAERDDQCIRISQSPFPNLSWLWWFLIFEWQRLHNCQSRMRHNQAAILLIMTPPYQSSRTKDDSLQIGNDPSKLWVLCRLTRVVDSCKDLGIEEKRKAASRLKNNLPRTT